MNSDTFEYIIAGGGMAGLSLAHYLNAGSVRDSRTLIIDRAEKNANDHTWCFWESGQGVFEDAVFHKWKSLWFHGSDEFSKLLEIGEGGADPLEYKMIRAIDFYSFVVPKLKDNPRIRFLQAGIASVGDGIVETDGGIFKASKYVFDSSTRKSYDDERYHNLLQHFMGWTIETEDDRFSPSEATLFDFRVPQEGECRFVYILPITAKRALVEFTVFSESVLGHEDYKANLARYITDQLGIGSYSIVETEQGIIPMSDEPHERNPGTRTVRIGTAGGFVKPSTGYSFSRTQERLKMIAENLAAGRQVYEGVRESPWKRYLDSILLNVLSNQRHPAKDVFTELFKRNNPEAVMRFLDEKTTFMEDLRIMRTVPLPAFSRAAAAVAARNMRQFLSP